MHFLRPARVRPVTASATVERAGRALTTATVRLEQDAKLVALGIGAFSCAWEAPEIGAAAMPQVAPPGEPGSWAARLGFGAAGARSRCLSS